MRFFDDKKTYFEDQNNLNTSVPSSFATDYVGMETIHDHKVLIWLNYNGFTILKD